MKINFEDLSKSDQDHIIAVSILKQTSPAKKRQVCAALGIVHKNGIDAVVMTSGINHMFKGIFNEQCEDENGETIPYVIHAEEDAISKYNKSRYHYDNILQSHNRFFKDITLYVTYSPCQNCCKQLALFGIKRIVFVEKHESNFHAVPFAPSEFLKQLGIEYIETSLPKNMEYLQSNTIYGIGFDQKIIFNDVNTKQRLN